MKNSTLFTISKIFKRLNIKVNIKKSWYLILEVLFPNECLSCKSAGESICEKCLLKIQNVSEKRNLNIRWIETVLDYKRKDVKDILYSLKYHHNKSVATRLAKVLAEKFVHPFSLSTGSFPQEAKPRTNDFLILPIPISVKRRCERGYNQSELIAEAIIKEIKDKQNLDLEKYYKKDFLIRQKHTIKFSHTHNKEERAKMIENAFSINSEYDFMEEIKENIKIILVDDIATTGATLYEARKVLIEFGFKKENVYAFVVGH